MKWAKNIKVLTRGTKVLIANLNNGKWVRTSNETYALVKNMVSENLDIGDLIFEEPEDKKYIEKAIEALVECQLLVVNDFMSCHQTAHTYCHQIA